MITPLFNEVINTPNTTKRRKGKKKVRKNSIEKEPHPELASKIFMTCLSMLSSSTSNTTVATASTSKPTKTIPPRRNNTNKKHENTTTNTWNIKSKNVNKNNENPIYKRSSTRQMDILKKRCSIIRWDQMINSDGPNVFQSNGDRDDDDNHKATNDNNDVNTILTMEQKQRLSIISFKIQESIKNELMPSEHEHIKFVTTKPPNKQGTDQSEFSSLSDDESMFPKQKSINAKLPKDASINIDKRPSVVKREEENNFINALLKDCLTSTEQSIMDTINNLHIDSDDDDDDSCDNNNVREHIRNKRKSSIFVIKRDGSVLVKDLSKKNTNNDDDDEIEEGCILVDFGNNYDSDDDYDE